MPNIDKIRHISFVKFLILFVAYMFFINYIFLFKGVFLGFLSGDTLSFSILLFALLGIFFLLLFAGVFLHFACAIFAKTSCYLSHHD